MISEKLIENIPIVSLILCPSKIIHINDDLVNKFRDIMA